MIVTPVQPVTQSHTTTSNPSLSHTGWVPITSSIPILSFPFQLSSVPLFPPRLPFSVSHLQSTVLLVLFPVFRGEAAVHPFRVLCFFFFFHRVSEIAKEMKPNVQIAARLRSQEQEAMTYPLLQGCKLEVIGKQILPHHVAGLGWLIFWTQLQTWCVHVDGEQRSQSADNIAKPNKRC